MINIYIKSLLVLSAIGIVGFAADSQVVQGVEIYELSDMIGVQTYFASHMKPETLQDSNKMDDEDRAAIMGAIGKTGIAMPRLKVPYVNASTRTQSSTLRILTIKDKDGAISEVGQNEYTGGKDEMMVLRWPDTINFIQTAEGVFIVYTIHLNVTFPKGEKLVTMQTTRNRPLGVSTTTVSGKAKRLQ